MNRRKIWFYSSLLIVLITITLLVTGSPLLTTALDKNDSIPLGTFITWVGLIALPLSVYWGIKEFRNPTTKGFKFLSIILKTVIVMAILWVPVSYLLSGNISFSFSEKVTFQGGQTAMRWFWRYTYGIALVSLLMLIAYWIMALLRKKH